MARYLYRPNHPKASANGFVSVDDLADWTDGDDMAIHAPICSGRLYENTVASDGTDIGSRRKRAEYMKIHGLADAADYKEHWAKKAEERAAHKRGESKDPALREFIGRQLYKHKIIG